MIELNVSELIKATGGQLMLGSNENVIKGISTDSRTINKDELFIALRGENYSGESYVEEALNKGACGYISQKERRGLSPVQSNGDCLQKIAIKVEDTLKALQDIARYVLKKVDTKVIAITGSTGKTSVKDMLASILSLQYRVVASRENYNNEVGLPLTLLELESTTEVVILEMAMRGVGQISELCSIATPDFAVITNTGKSHIGLLKNSESIIKAKAEIIVGLKENGILFLNGDDKATEEFTSLYKSVVLFGNDESFNLSFSDVEFDDLARPSFNLHHKNNQLRVKLPVAGIHQALNASCAASVALELGISLDDVKEGLQKAKLSTNRMEINKVNGLFVINDSYNASPASMAAALDVLKGIKAKRKIAVLGDMLELGDLATQEHEKIGQRVVKAKIDELLTVGPLAKNIAEAAIEAGMEESDVKSFKDASELKNEIISYLKDGDAILIKASRALKLDEIVNYLQKKR
ncbi:MAG: UDP-N-acetylmuramoyl-tripeptide--D-alanyl-D-alanine ligase [Actinobacteria bacterium]|nr:MAG: UDP-N-acetylmuramoyl-tripeptide--D-alanyl-D-alanine ligase [Actinomycetota bacterium]